MELELSLSPPNQKRQPMKKSFHGNDRGCLRFPLVSWNQDEDDDEHDSRFFNGDYNQDLDSDKEGLIGWPPVNSWRKRYIEENKEENVNVMNDNNNNNNNNIQMEVLVKVKMDGVGIARKINLNVFHSYQMLYNTLIHMFEKYDGASYKLMYQTQDGYWLLAGDIPWEMFTHTVKRIQMVKN